MKYILQCCPYNNTGSFFPCKEGVLVCIDKGSPYNGKELSEHDSIEIIEAKLKNNLVNCYSLRKLASDQLNNLIQIDMNPCYRYNFSDFLEEYDLDLEKCTIDKKQ